MNIDIETIERDYDRLRWNARNLTDIMQTRIRLSNRQGAYERSGGVDFDTEDILALQKTVEEGAVKGLTTIMREIVGPHMTAFLATKGIGDGKLPARLLGEIGHPVVAIPRHWEERPDAKGTAADPKRVLVKDAPFLRTPGQLWRYCGYGNPEDKHRKGMAQEELFLCGNTIAKSLVYLMSKNCVLLTGNPDKNGVVKARSPYRNVYDETKARYETIRPEWTPIHRQNATLRKVSKEILKDLWVAAKADLAETEQALPEAA